MAMDSAQIRPANFMRLFADFINDHPHLPQRGMLKLFAQKLGLSERYLSHIKCQRKNIGHQMARTIEKQLRLPHGWMDQAHASHSTPADDHEKLFIETALTLFRSRPEQAREVMMNLLRQQLLDAA